MTVVIREPRAFAAACNEIRSAGHRLGLVPTMGALHRGHHSLVDEATRRTDAVAVTVFVNPTQFAPGEDLSKYPRTFDDDVQACRERNVALVFAPAPPAIYPDGFQTTVSLNELTQPLEGAFRPTHFSGVTTVVTKLLNLAGPCTALFGRKDYQQWRLIEALVRDLNMPIEVVGCPIVREADGLALSSRNRYLSAAERKRSLAIVEGLRQAHDAWRGGQRSAGVLQALASTPVERGLDAVDYVAAVNPKTLLSPDPDAKSLLIAVAAHLGGTRLIDNIVLGEDPRP